MPSAEFDQAVKKLDDFKVWAKDNNKKLSNDELLDLYSLFKIANQQEPKAAGMFDFEGKAKFNAYKKLKDEGVTPEQADQRYVKLVDDLFTKYEYKS